MEIEKSDLIKKIDDCDKVIDSLGERMKVLATSSELEKYKTHLVDVEKILSKLPETETIFFLQLMGSIGILLKFLWD